MYFGSHCVVIPYLYCNTTFNIFKSGKISVEKLTGSILNFVIFPANRGNKPAPAWKRHVRTAYCRSHAP